MSGENWAEYVDEKMQSEVEKPATWAQVDADRKEYIEAGVAACKDGMPVELAVSLIKAGMHGQAAMYKLTVEQIAQCMLMAECWIREGYERAKEEG